MTPPLDPPLRQDPPVREVRWRRFVHVVNVTSYTGHLCPIGGRQRADNRAAADVRRGRPRRRGDEKRVHSGRVDMGT